MMEEELLPCVLLKELTAATDRFCFRYIVPFSVQALQNPPQKVTVIVLRVIIVLIFELAVGSSRLHAVRLL